MRADYTIRDRDTLSATYTIDDGNSLIPLADPLFGSYSALRMQVASLQETHVISPRHAEYLPRRLLPCGIQSGFGSVGHRFRPNLSFVTGGGPGGIVVDGGVTTTGLSGITAAGPNNAAGVWNRRNLFTFTDGLQISKGRTRSAPESGFSGCRTTKTPRRANSGKPHSPA